MEVRVLIERKFTKDHIPFLTPILKQLYAIVFEYGGYISGESLVDFHDPEKHLIISKWSSLDNWQAYHKDERVKKLCSEINLIIGHETSHRVFRKE